MNELSTVALEAKALLELAKRPGNNPKLYVLLTDTGTGFSKLSKWITEDPYNHVSLALDAELDHVYTYALKTSHNGSRGGLKRETLDILKGARYSLYEMTVTPEMYQKVVQRIDELESRIEETRYNHFGLLNALTGKVLIKSEGMDAMICSHFLAAILAEVGVEFFKNRDHSTIKPYEFAKSKLLKHVRRGTF